MNRNSDSGEFHGIEAARVCLTYSEYFHLHQFHWPSQLPCAGGGTEAQRICVCDLRSCWRLSRELNLGLWESVAYCLSQDPGFPVVLSQECMKGHRLESLSYWTFLPPAGRDGTSMFKAPPESVWLRAYCWLPAEENRTSCAQGTTTLHLPACGVVTLVPHAAPANGAQGS